jgi:hypothetical protein
MLLRLGRNFSVLGVSAVAAGTLVTLGAGALLVASHHGGETPLTAALHLPTSPTQDARPPQTASTDARGHARFDKPVHAPASAVTPAPVQARHRPPDASRAPPPDAGKRSPGVATATMAVTPEPGGEVSLQKSARQRFFVPGQIPREMTVRVGPSTPVLRPVSPITPISVETRVVPRPDVDPRVVRTGSIRADIARYNAEHMRHPAAVRRSVPYVPPPHDAWPYAH